MAEFTHLHVHSHYSLLDGNPRVHDLVDAARRAGMDSLALTDHGNLYGAIEFYRTATAAGIKPIIGMEAYLAAKDHRLRTGKDEGNETYHITLLATNEDGYHNLIRLTSQSFLHGFYRKPRIDKQLLKTHGKGLIALSGCMSGEVARAVLRGDQAAARQAAAEYVDILGPGNYYLEIMRNGLKEQDRIREKLCEISHEMDVPLVATNDVHYICPGDALAQEVMLCINMGKTLAEQNRMRMSTDQFYFRSADEMVQLFDGFPQAVKSTREIAERCSLKLSFDQYHLPQFTPPDGSDSRTYFRNLCTQGLRERYGDPPPPAAAQRLEMEMGIIEQMGFASYFLVVWDFIRFARENGVPVGPGRGSAAGSIVAYALRITSVDPLRYDLLFERFLNSSRISMPDIDIDFCRDGRERVIRYVQEKYGADNVCQIVTFGTMAAKAAIRDAGRVLGIATAEVDTIAKKIPSTPGTKLEDALQDPELDALQRTPTYENLFKVARKLEGLNRHASTHAAGVVIADRPLSEYVPLCRVQDEVNTQFTMTDLEAIGLLKMDFLGLKTLTIIQRAVDSIRDHHGVTIDTDNLPLDDARTFTLLQRGETSGVFQLESSGMRQLLGKMKPDCFEDIIAILALYRPGPLGSGMVDSFVNRKHGKEEIAYLHPLLEPVLKETNGVILYQEQVMRITNALAGFALNEADTLRKAMGKKKPEVMQKFRSKFIDGCRQNGVTEATAQAIWEQMEYFAGYGFNKSHSTAYGLITFSTAYLKANYPLAFMAALMSCELSDSDKLLEYLGECRRMGVEILGPDLNHSAWEFSLENQAIRFGLGAVKGLGEKAVQAIIAERGKRASGFASLGDFVESLDPAVVGKGALEALIKSGAFDWTGHRRAQLFEAMDLLLASAKSLQQDKRQGQRSLFKSKPGGMRFNLADVPEWLDRQKLANEKEVLGFPFSDNPVAKYADVFKRFTTCSVAALADQDDGKQVVVGGEIAQLRFTMAKKGRNAG
ncbi:MAG: DNA polymerase III subunit alpha, partial [Planctomycetota bacterium]